jgi:hypothetical protein
MIIIDLQNINGLNVSLQVGDLIYASPALVQTNAIDLQADTNDSLGIGNNYLVGVLRQILFPDPDTISLYIDENAGRGLDGNYLPQENDFLMFSKYNRGGSGVLGYYAQAKFVNNSTEKAELFAVSSEIIINSK